MQRSGKLITLFLILSGLLSCEGTTFRSSVPAYPVRVIVDTRIGAFVHFQPEALGSFVVANKEGYYLDNQWVSSSSAMDAYGYGGVVVYIGAFGYNAYDFRTNNTRDFENITPDTEGKIVIQVVGKLVGTRASYHVNGFRISKLL